METLAAYSKLTLRNLLVTYKDVSMETFNEMKTLSLND